MEHSHNLRKRKSIDWKKLCYGENLVLKRETSVPHRDILPDIYYIERLISRRFERNQRLYLVKWKGFPVSDCTWEPERHIDEDSLGTFQSPCISEERLSNAAKLFEESVQQRLKSKLRTSYIRFDLDIYRYCFDTYAEKQINSINDFEKLPMSKNWFYSINEHGRGLKMSFPLTLTPKLHMRKVFIKENGVLLKKMVPLETVRMVSATGVCLLEDL